MTGFDSKRAAAADKVHGYDWSMLEAAQESLREHMARIKELEAQLAQPAQEPVAFITNGGTGELWWSRSVDEDGNPNAKDIPLYTHPPKREWIGLTDEEILKMAYPIRWQEIDDFEADKAVNFAQMVEAKLKEKNT